MRWLDHVTDELVCKCEIMRSEGVIRGRGRPKIIRKEVILKDLQALEINADLAKHRAHGKKKIYIGVTN